MTQNDKQRDVKRPYRKKAFQTGYSLITDTTDSTPRPLSSYSTTETQATVPVRPGIDPQTYQKMTRPSVEGLEFTHALDTASFNWNAVPKPDSSNLIGRQKVNFAAAPAGVGNLAVGDWYDILVINVSGIAGSQTATGTGSPPPPQPALTVTQISPASNDTASGQNARFPNQGGVSGTAVAGSVQQISADEVYRISTFGHTEGTGTGVTYQIWVDGSLFMEWADFQWSAIIPRVNQWKFDQPITVTQQIVFRVFNTAAATGVQAGQIEACFAGWTEQFTGYTDVSYQQLTPTNN
tara:strand:- start:91 stop:972 length:882 start_codon:yes stop_codon:yes gene_type:complete